MDPESIEPHKTEVSEQAKREKARQRVELEVELGMQAALVVAVGPELFESYSVRFHERAEVHQFLPGLFEVSHLANPVPLIKSCLMFCRTEDAQLKGVFLAAQALVSWARSGDLSESAQRTQFVIRGAKLGHTDLRERVAKEIPADKIRLFVREFTADRNKLEQELRASSLVLMPSLEEGFGLSGLEAISHGVPVLVSRTSGLGQALRKHLPEIADTHTFAIEGGAESLAQKIRQRLGDVDESFQNARELRSAMAETFCWKRSARELVNRLVERRRVVDSPRREVGQVGNAQRMPYAELGLATRFRNASGGVFGWRQTLPRGQWLERPELEKLVHFASVPQTAPLVVLGAPGSGKSALLARFATELEKTEVAVLAIKADELPASVATLSDLQRELSLPMDVVGCVRAAAELGPVVVLYDQLDALADILDMQSERLDLLLRLAGDLVCIDHVHLVMSCRTFEFRHDVRLSKLEPHELELTLPPLSEVERVLADEPGASQLSEQTKSLLRYPHALASYQKLDARRGGEFTSDVDLIGTLWSQRFAGTESLAVDALALARLMSDHEELWLAWGLLEALSLRESALHLARLGILVENRGRIAFAHQTLFEFALSRSFLAGGKPLLDHAQSKKQGLFVRRTLWVTLKYLRAVDRNRYEKELQDLWDAVRMHLKWLLIEFLGEVSEPSIVEQSMLLPLLGEPRFRAKVCEAIGRNRTWFVPSLSTLPALMTHHPDCSLQVLVPASAVELKRVVDLVNSQWLAEREFGPVRVLLANTLAWSPELTILAERVMSERLDPQVADGIVRNVVKFAPEEAPRLVALHLERRLSEVKEVVAAQASVRPESAVGMQGEAEADWVARMRDSERAKPFQALLDEGGLYYVGAKEAADARPGEFLIAVWPWFVRLASSCKRPTIGAFFAHGLTLTKDEDEVRMGSILSRALRHAAEADSNFVESFVCTWWDEDCSAVHEAVVRLLTLALPISASLALEYLLRDPRALNAPEAVGLLRQLGEHIGGGQVAELETAIRLASPYEVPQNASPRQKWNRARANRHHQYERLCALGECRLSPEARSIVNQEHLVFGTTETQTSSPGIHAVESPMSTQQILNARDEHIVGLFEELVDATEWRHPRDWTKGGSIEASRSLALAAVQDPERFLSLLDQFAAGANERPVAHVILALCERLPLARVEEALHHQVSRGLFTAPEFREMMADAVVKASRDDEVPEERTCDLFQSWLVDVPGVPKNEQDLSELRQARSLLFDDFPAFSVRPHGNFPTLRALAHAYLGRTPPDHERWLATLESHLLRTEDSAVWIALCPLIHYLRGSFPDRCAGFLEQLFSRYPGVRDSGAGLRLIAHFAADVPEVRLQRWMLQTRDGEWGLGRQGFCELLVFLATRLETSQWAQSRLQDELTQIEQRTDGFEAAMLGLTYAATRLWELPRARPTTVEIIERIAPQSTPKVAQVVGRLFAYRRATYWDSNMERILGVFSKYPGALAPESVPLLAEALTRLLPQRADVISRLVGSLVSHWAKDDVSLGRIDRRFVDVTLTLQRCGEPARTDGLEAFETLLSGGCYSIRPALRNLDDHATLAAAIA
jgi:hypothetical protein